MRPFGRSPSPSLPSRATAASPSPGRATLSPQVPGGEPAEADRGEHHGPRFDNEVTCRPTAAGSSVLPVETEADGLRRVLPRRLSLRKGRGDTRLAKIVCSPMLPEGEAGFGISENGAASLLSLPTSAAPLVRPN